MIVGRRFDGDGHTDKWVMRQQRDVYGLALHIITDTCQEYAQLAHKLIGDPSEDYWFIYEYDHRTLQHSHDILAAVWRYRHENVVRQMQLPAFRTCLVRDSVLPPFGFPYERPTEWVRRQDNCPQPPSQRDMDRDSLWGPWECLFPRCSWLTKPGEPDFIGHWLRWLQKEVQSWDHSPHLVRHVLQILQNQNQQEGYQAEAALSSDLIDRFDDVPWTIPAQGKPTNDIA